MSVDVSVDPPKFKYGEMIEKFATAIREYKNLVSSLLFLSLLKLF